MHDVIIVGGSYAGLAAATQLGRARRDVLVLDTSLPRNRFAAAAHGFLTHDGSDPAEILATARTQLLHYRTVQLEQGEAIAASRTALGFSVELRDGSVVESRRLVLAHGLRDIFGDIPGFAECWGRTVLHCPYCHGYEVADRRLGLMVRQGSELQLAKFYHDWSENLTLFTNGGAVDALVREGLADLGVKLVEATILRLDHSAGVLRSVILADGEVPLDALFSHPPVAFSTAIGVDLGCEIKHGALGPFFNVDLQQMTSVAGVYAAGDIARPAHNISFAVGDGAGAGIFAHQSLFD